MSYLAAQALRLAAGALQLPESLARRHAAYLAAAQNIDGGFSGRQGPSDLYYTSFALRGLSLLGRLDDCVARPAAGFLQRRLEQQVGTIDFLALVPSAVLLELVTGEDVFAAGPRDRLGWVSAFLQDLRRDDGGYAKGPGGRQSSTYATFLAASCLQLLGLSVEDAAAMASLVRSRRRADGGFVEAAPLKQGGTNPTAAAVATLRLLDGLDGETARSAAAFLAGMQNAEGGLRANTRIPIADLLSTFTGLVALADLGKLALIDRAAVRRYVASLEMPAGGFRGGAWDNDPDVEYTFYGLGSLALLEAVES
ncbi:MAG: beta-hydroxylase [Pirellulales bacterium]|nr:beta-hydroxylase [Pirellulales bacterium]